MTLEERAAEDLEAAAEGLALLELIVILGEGT